MCLTWKLTAQLTNRYILFKLLLKAIRRFRVAIKSRVPWVSTNKHRIRPRVWSIGIYSGTSPFEITPVDGIDNPVIYPECIQGISTNLVADPFMVKENNRWLMFFEVLNRQAQKGEIGLAESENGLSWRFRQIVLNEAHHLSYPYVFRWQDNHYMCSDGKITITCCLSAAKQILSDYTKHRVFQLNGPTRQPYSAAENT